MAELEAILGFALFERTTRKVTLTTDGREFLPSAIAVQRQMNLAVTKAADVRNRSVEVVRIAAPMAVAATIQPNLVATFRLKNPRVVCESSTPVWTCGPGGNRGGGLGDGPRSIGR